MNTISSNEHMQDPSSKISTISHGHQDANKVHKKRGPILYHQVPKHPLLRAQTPRRISLDTIPWADKEQATSSRLGSSLPIQMPSMHAQVPYLSPAGHFSSLESYASCLVSRIMIGDYRDSKRSTTRLDAYWIQVNSSRIHVKSYDLNCFMSFRPPRIPDESHIQKLESPTLNSSLSDENPYAVLYSNSNP